MTDIVVPRVLGVGKNHSLASQCINYQIGRKKVRKPRTQNHLWVVEAKYLPGANKWGVHPYSNGYRNRERARSAKIDAEKHGHDLGWRFRVKKYVPQGD